MNARRTLYLAVVLYMQLLRHKVLRCYSAAYRPICSTSL